jgi:aspartate-semialdehyde dehydrogenase
MLTKKSAYSIAVAGATGTIGKEILERLETRNFPIGSVTMLASERSEGERVQFSGRSYVVKRLADDSFADIDIAFFATPASHSKRFIPAAVKAGSVAIDLSSAFRADTAVPLVAADINAEEIVLHKGIIACPDSSALALAAVLKPLHDEAGLMRFSAVSLQSVSGAGEAGMQELASQTAALLNFREAESGAFPHRIAFNSIPQVGEFLDNGWTDRESGILEEVKRLLGDAAVRGSVTAVLVPVFRGSSEVITAELKQKRSVNDIRAILAAASGIVIYDDPQKSLYPLAMDASGRDDIYVGRIREDESGENGIALWIASDNVGSGAALNAVRIAELLAR